MFLVPQRTHISCVLITWRLCRDRNCGRGCCCGCTVWIFVARTYSIRRWGSCTPGGTLSSWGWPTPVDVFPWVPYSPTRWSRMNRVWSLLPEGWNQSRQPRQREPLWRSGSVFPGWICVATRTMSINCFWGWRLAVGRGCCWICWLWCWAWTWRSEIIWHPTPNCWWSLVSLFGWLISLFVSSPYHLSPMWVLIINS